MDGGGEQGVSDLSFWDANVILLDIRRKSETAGDDIQDGRLF